MDRELNFKKLGTGPPIVIVHGLFGSLDNWMTFAKRLSDNFEVFAVDLRNHGKSFHSDQMSLESMSSDLHQFWLKHIDQPCFWMGHSLGGKVVISLTQHHVEIIQKAIILDISPKQYPRGHDRYFKAMFSLKLHELSTRKDANLELEKGIPDFAVRQFLLKNLKRKEGGGFEWKFNLSSLFDNYDGLLDAISINDCPVEIMFIKGQLSNYISPDDHRSILSSFPKAQFKTIVDAGHWVHADKPEELLEVVKNYLV